MERKNIQNVIINFLKRNATWKSIIILLILIIVFNFLIFPLFHTKNEDNLILDTQFSYSPEKAYAILADYNTEELKEYCIGVIVVDFVYPIVYTLFLCFFSFKLFENKTLSLLPLLILFSDYIENFGIVTIINYYPQKLPNIVRLTSLFSSLKWTFIGISVLLIVVLLLIKLYNRKKST